MGTAQNLYRTCLGSAEAHLSTSTLSPMALRPLKPELNRMAEYFWPEETVKTDLHLLGKGEGLVHGMAIVGVCLALGDMAW